MTLLLLACVGQPEPRTSSAASHSVASRAPVFVVASDGIRTNAARGGPQVRFSTSGVTLGADLAVGTTTFGRISGLVAVSPATPTLADCGGVPCVQLTTPGLAEWWTAHDGGLEQSWTVATAPVGAGELVVDLAMPGAEVAVAGQQARLQSPSGKHWVMSGLRAWDADAVVLPSAFRQVPGGVQIVVDDGGARYPVTIDPTYSTPDVEFDVEWRYGTTVAGGGDINGDGYGDIVVVLMQGSGAWVYFGTPSSVESEWAGGSSFGGLETFVQNGVPVAFAGDLNADGYDEVIIEADEDQAVYVFGGSAVGWGVDEEPTWVLPDLAGLGDLSSVDGAGDVNGDGYDDVIVGGPDHYYGRGAARVYLGSSTGPQDDAAVVELHAQEDENERDEFGRSVTGAGDVNGDGYDDVVVGALAPYTTVFYGSAIGISDGARTALEMTELARSVSGAGDVNGDGYDDVVVGDSRSGVSLFLGGADGIGAEAVWNYDGDDCCGYGWSVATAGDVNGDGYADVVTTFETYREDGGYADLFLGSIGGLESEPTASLWTLCVSVSTAGDVDRDGLDDVVVSPNSVYLAATFLDPSLADPPDTGGDTDADADTDADGDSDTDSDTEADSGAPPYTDSPPQAAPKKGCSTAPGGCATGPGSASGLPLVLALGVCVARRRAGMR